MNDSQLLLDWITENLKKVLSFHYDDRPMDDSIYYFHRHWIQFFHDYYFKIEHIGNTKAVQRAAKKESVLLISNHVIALEAAWISYYFFVKKLGKIGTLVYPEAFKLPFIREFFRSAQCVPISIEAGIRTLKEKHILVFPEGMDFINGLVHTHQLSKFHRGFLRMAKGYLESTGKKSVSIIPVAHSGMEHVVKLWVIKDKEFLDKFIRPFADYPFWIIPKFPFLLPSKVIINWGTPVKISLKDLENEKKIAEKANSFRRTLLTLRKEAKEMRKLKSKD